MSDRIGRGEFLVLSSFIQNQFSPTGIMQDTTTLAQQISAAASVATCSINLSTDPKRIAIIKVWNAMLRGARKYVESEGFVCNVKLHSGAGVSMARVAQFILSQTDTHDCVPFLINRENVI
ncbi:hypothetical protein [Hymenobacter cavernae]|uniref:Uncharacterized protein n=1 Tax=Hymenobacter cavernae TaxID=2044852 RepID=A0ABQ1TQP9_9BACT|nr:hypothetical protein [Hymenobacter cavernae]GGE99796.1 hypothetical protein GCM10011383_08330 [Hymenobacter cavernae]